MVINNYFLVFPEGEIQEIDHPLKFGDLVDINGNVFHKNDLNPRSITYKITGIKNETKFKETTYYYKLDLFTADEVREEINFFDLMDKKDKFLDNVMKKLEKKVNKGVRKF
jgi:hypothetical protein